MLKKILKNRNNKVTHIIPQKNNQFIESEVIELKATKPNDTRRISPLPPPPPLIPQRNVKEKQHLAA